jgi:hypothetical protein
MIVMKCFGHDKVTPWFHLFFFGPSGSLIQTFSSEKNAVARGRQECCTYSLSLIYRLNQTDSAIFMYFFAINASEGSPSSRFFYRFSFLLFKCSTTLNTTVTYLFRYKTVSFCTCVQWLYGNVCLINILLA